MAMCIRFAPVGQTIGTTSVETVKAIGITSVAIKDGFCNAGSYVLFTQDDLKMTIKSEPIDENRVADMQSLFLAFLGVLVLVWGAKQLLNLFTSDNSRD